MAWYFRQLGFFAILLFLRILWFPSLLIPFAAAQSLSRKSNILGLIIIEGFLADYFTLDFEGKNLLFFLLIYAFSKIFSGKIALSSPLSQVIYGLVLLLGVNFVNGNHPLFTFDIFLSLLVPIFYAGFNLSFFWT